MQAEGADNLDNHNVSDELSEAKKHIEQLEKELWLQKEKFESIISHMPDPTVIFKGDGSIESINQAALASLERIQLQPGEIGDLKNNVCFFDAQDQPIPFEDIPPVRIMRGDKLVNFRVKAKFGPNYSYIDFNGIPIRSEDGAILYAIMSFRNVTALVNSEDQYRFLIESMQSGVVHQTSDGTIISMNRAAEQILGKRSEDFLGSSSVKVQHHTIREDGRVFPGEEHPAMAALRTGEPNQDTIMGVFNPKRNAYRWININAVPMFRPGDSKPYQVFTVFDDITEKRIAEDALIKSETLFRSVLENSSDLTYCYNVQKNFYEYTSQGCKKILGFTQQEMMAMDLETVHSMIHPDDREIFGEPLNSVLAEKGEAEIQYRQRSKSGEYRWLVNRLSLVRDEDGRVLYRNGNIQDITERKLIEDALRERDTHLRLAAKNGDLGTYAFDFVVGKAYISDELKALWGLKPDEPVEFDEDTLYFRGLHPDDKKIFYDKILEANNPNGDGFVEFDYRIIRPDGSVKSLLMRGQTTFAGEGAHRQPVFTAGVVIDVTKRTEDENSIREISEELRNIIESTDDFIWSVDKDFRLVLFNSSFERFIKSKFRKQLTKGLRMKDILTPQNGALWEDLYERTAADGKFQVEMKIDRASRVMSYSFNPVYAHAELVEITVFGKDITERLNSEREIIRLNASLEKRVSERTEELQKSVKNLQNLSQIISHDLKEPIREIETYAIQIGKNADVPSNASNIKRTCISMTRMIEDLSKYAMSSQHKLHIESVNVKKKVISIYNDLKSIMTNRSVLQFESGLPLVCADKVLLRQALYNLLSNAMKFSGKKELAEITVGCAEENGQYVFHIRDNGVGFDMKYANKLFNIFERLHTDEEFEGSGIGLAAVRNIIQRHGGRIWIESEEDTGTVVYFTLPVHNEN